MKEPREIAQTPIPKDSEDAYRWEHTRQAKRMLYGCWEIDLEKWLLKQIGKLRREAWGTLDLSANLFRAIWDSIAVLYDRNPIVSNPNPAANILTEKGGALDTSGVWSFMARVQRDVLGLREMLVRVDVAEDGELTFRAITPDLVVATPRTDKPDKPIRIEECRLRINPETGDSEWTWDIYDLTDINNPIYIVMDEKQEVDLTELYLQQDLSGDNYPYRKSDGTPVLPFVMYHAAHTGMLWDPYSNKELITGTLQVGAMYTYLTHIIRSASWPQRYAVGVKIATEVINNSGDGIGPSGVTVDPTTVTIFQHLDSEEGGAPNPMIGQWSNSADPEKVSQTIERYENRLMTFAGLNGADLQRMSGDPRSGYAVSVSREAQREVQRRFEPQFRKADLELISLCAILLNRKVEGLNLPEDGYQIRYQALPKSPEEERAERDHVLALMQAGLMDRVTAYQRLNEVSREEAVEAIRKIDENRIIETVGGN